MSGVEARGIGDVICDIDGRIITEKWIPNWSDLSIQDRKKVMAEIKRLGVRLGKVGKGEKGGTPG